MSSSADSRTPTLIKPESIHGWSANSKELFFPAL
jgi:hypothetical protein